MGTPEILALLLGIAIGLVACLASCIVQYKRELDKKDSTILNLNLDIHELKDVISTINKAEIERETVKGENTYSWDPIHWKNKYAAHLQRPR